MNRAGAFAALFVVTALAAASVVVPLAFSAREQLPAVLDVPEGPPGDLVYRKGTMSMRLTDRPCGIASIAEALENEGIPPALAYVMTQEGRPQVRGCWVVNFDREVLVMDIGGGDGFIPLDWFKRDPGV